MILHKQSIFKYQQATNICSGQETPFANISVKKQNFERERKCQTEWQLILSFNLFSLQNIDKVTRKY